MGSASLGPSLVDMECAGTLQYPDDTEDVFLPCHEVQGKYFTQTTMLTEYKNIWCVQKDDTIGCRDTFYPGGHHCYLSVLDEQPWLVSTSPPNFSYGQAQRLRLVCISTGQFLESIDPMAFSQQTWGLSKIPRKCCWIWNGDYRLGLEQPVFEITPG